MAAYSMTPVATFSIVAVDLAAGDAGVAVASKFLAAGAVVPWASASAGAVATQAFANASYGPRGLDLMRAGASATEAMQKLIADDANRDRRQFGLVDARGGAAAHTGKDCFAWVGHVVGEHFACQGNILAGADIVAAMAQSFRSSRGALAERLVAALAAGEAAGGDRRGRQSAALAVAREAGGYLGFNDVLVDLRVDDHADPVAELRRLLALQNLYFGESPASEKVALTGAVLVELKRMMIAGASFAGEATSEWDDATLRALDAFISAENLEERVDLNARTIDAPALAHLRERLLQDGRM